MSKVAEKLSRVRLQLMLQHPFLAAAVARLPMIEIVDRPWCQTMATDGYHIYWNEKFCNGLSEDHLLGVIAHELMHCIFGHGDRRGDRNRALWNLAIDHATNLFLLACGVPLPDDRLADRRYRGLTAEQIYERIVGSLSPQEIESLKGGLFAEGGFDAHLEEHDVEGASDRAQDLPTAAERRRIRKELGRAAAEKSRGLMPGNFEEEFKKGSESRVSWQAILARFISGVRKDDYRLYPFNRRHIWRELYLPSIGMPGPQHIVVAVDTSGSMNSKIFEKVLSELDALRARTQCKLTLIECDAEIQGVSTYEGWELSNKEFSTRTFRGRGGTKFEPVFEWVDEHWHQNPPPPDALIYLTDGFAEFPEIAPNYYVLWGLPEGTDRSPPFGQVLEIL